MTALWIVISVALGVAALLGTVRLFLGPSILDRALSVDVLVASAMTGLGAYAAFNQDPTILPTLLVLALVGFTSSISISKFVARRPEEYVPPQSTTDETGTGARQSAPANGSDGSDGSGGSDGSNGSDAPEKEES
ncbi:monovalent cation/H+ antiporter complex subunit F [Nocardiopsis coralli]|uniref:monovalent cation/H+ antiporter complex subunit F n=1 Tax=Nocardiopsis coralli TaxID=2772213 RepID=UPI002E290C24|nr:monovalent cation/H+ antiporter complex subunit F [Nocardiopsis coralli]